MAASIALACTSTAIAAPFAPADTRSIGMGGTGVAAAELHSAVLFNPALLATARDEHDFSVVLPQMGLFVADEDEFVDGVSNFVDADHSDNFDALLPQVETAMDSVITQLELLDTAISGAAPGAPAFSTTALTNAVNTLTPLTGSNGSLRVATNDMTSDLEAISGRAIYGTIGIGAGVAIPSKSLAAAVSLNTSMTFAGLLDVSKRDLNTISSYVSGVEDYTNKVEDLTIAVTELNALQTGGGTAGQINLKSLEVIAAQDQLNKFEATNADGETLISIDAAGGAQTADITLTSSSRLVGIAISEIGVGLAREFDFNFDVADGMLDTWSIGVTPKVQRIDIYDYSYSFEEKDGEDNGFESSDFTDTAVSKTAFNFDIGVSKQFLEEGNLIAGMVIKNVIPATYKSENNLGKESVEIKLEPQVRVGVSHRTEWTVVTADLDLTENAAIAFESPTRYAALGAEFDLFDTLQLRAGYRTNLSDTDDKLATIGFGLSPFGVHMDISAGVNPEDTQRNAAVGLEFGFYF
jgi:hypothetical protein